MDAVNVGDAQKTNFETKLPHNCATASGRGAVDVPPYVVGLTPKLQLNH